MARYFLPYIGFCALALALLSSAALANGAQALTGRAMPLGVAAGPASALIGARRSPLAGPRSATPLGANGGARASLFDQHRMGLRTAPGVSPPVARLLGLIAEAEAGGAGYDAVQHGALVRPPRAPTDMTLAEIFAWIDATPGQPHAIGRYQFIPPTLARVVQARGFGPGTRFTPTVQDALAHVLLEEAGLEAFDTGAMPRDTFMRNLARIWAGLPLRNGRSYYHGHAGNRATMTWARFETGMAEIWPQAP